MSPFASTPAPPYYAVIFTRTTGDDTSGYAEAAQRMLELAARQPGFLGVESASERGAAAVGITVSYWRDEESIAGWKAHVEHEETRNEGRARWYEGYELRVAKVERAYRWRHAS